jgi:sugar lactone lactonase YvrE
VWDAADGSLVWVDIPAGEVHRCALEGRALETRTLPAPLGAVVLREAGGLVAAAGDGFLFVGAGGTPERHIPVEAELPQNRMNDAKADRRGRLWAGTMAEDETPGAGSLYRLEPDGRVERVLSGVGMSNGLDWSVDGRTFYYVDSLAHAVQAFTFAEASGSLSARRVLVDLGDAVPDGLTVDAEGCIWVALYGAGVVRRYSPAGDFVGELAVPAANVTSCVFGGPAYDTLFVTSAQRGAQDDPAAGAVFFERPGVTGLPPNRFAG